MKDNEPKRVALYKLAASLVRAYSNLANEMEEAGYSEAETREIKGEVTHFEKLREEVKLRSADYVDMKVFEPAMRHLLDTYLRAEESEVVSSFDDMTLVDLIVNRGVEAIDSLPKGLQNSNEAVAETIENNVRKVIIDEMDVNPKYYEKMSDLLDDLIIARRRKALDYRDYLEQVVELTKKVRRPELQTTYPSVLSNAPLRALYDNLKDYTTGASLTGAPYGEDSPATSPEEIAVRMDKAIVAVKKDGWRENRAKQMEVKNAIKSILGNDREMVNKIFEIVKNQREY